MNQKIRIKLRSYDHNLVDKSTEKIVKTVRNSGAVVTTPAAINSRFKFELFSNMLAVLVLTNNNQ